MAHPDEFVGRNPHPSIASGEPPLPPASRYRVWFTPNPPRKAFTVEVESLEMAVALDATLTYYSLYLGEELIPVSAGGIEEWDEANDDWFDTDLDEDVLPEMRQRFAESTKMTR